MLKFSPGIQNQKLKKLEKLTNRKVYSLSLLSGHSCPYAKDCHSKVVDGHIEDGKFTKFRCFSASQEALHAFVFDQRKYNTNQILKCKNNLNLLKSLIQRSLPKHAELIRIHVAGDFLTQNYFDAWLDISATHNSVHFYAYTKSLPFWVKRIKDIPDNLSLTASYGGHKDELIEKYGLKYAKVVYTRREAQGLGLRLDFTDRLAAFGKQPFALLLHGVQPAKSETSIYVKNGRNLEL